MSQEARHIFAKPGPLVLGAALLLGIAGQSNATPPRAAKSDFDGLDEKETLMVDIQQNKYRNKNGNGNGGDSSNQNCGQIDIGNSQQPKTGSAQVAGQATTVIVTGPVINATQCK